jgi:hypothetical protein
LKVRDYDPASQWLRRLPKEAVSDLPHEPPSIPDSGHDRQTPSVSSRRPR